MSTRSAWYERCSSLLSAARQDDPVDGDQPPLGVLDARSHARWRVDQVRASFPIDHLAGHDQIVAGVGGIERTGEAGRDQPARPVAGDEHIGRAPGRRPAHAGDGHGDDLARVLTLDHGNGDRLVFPDLFQTIDQVADLHRHGRDDTDVGWNRGRRPATFIVLAGVPLAGRALLHRENGGSIQESCHLIILSVSPRRPLTPTAADIS